MPAGMPLTAECSIAWREGVGGADEHPAGGGGGDIPGRRTKTDDARKSEPSPARGVAHPPSPDDLVGPPSQPLPSSPMPYPLPTPALTLAPAPLPPVSPPPLPPRCQGLAPGSRCHQGIIASWVLPVWLMPCCPVKLWMSAGRIDMLSVPFSVVLLFGAIAEAPSFGSGASSSLTKASWGGIGGKGVRGWAVFEAVRIEYANAHANKQATKWAAISRV